MSKNRAKFGRKGDTVIRKVNGVDSHVSKAEAYLIDNYGKTGQEIVSEIGANTKNPVTGLPEYYTWEDFEGDLRTGADYAKWVSPTTAAGMWVTSEIIDFNRDRGEYWDKHVGRGSFIRGVTGETKWKPFADYKEGGGQLGIFGKTKGRRDWEKKRAKSRKLMVESAREDFRPKLEYDELGLSGGFGENISMAQSDLTKARSRYEEDTETWGEGGTEELAALDTLETTKSDLKRHLRQQIQLSNEEKLMGSREVEAQKIASGMAMHGASEETALVPDSDKEIEIGIVETEEDIKKAELGYADRIADIRKTFKQQVQDPYDIALEGYSDLFKGTNSIQKQYENFIKSIEEGFYTQQADPHDADYNERYAGSHVGTFYDEVDTELDRARTMDFGEEFKFRG
tara:strand:- start:440 stop:1636 length:1197 start_codon:yes stop_codon:yes gene_type:complete